MTEGWMCCQLVDWSADKGDIPLDVGYSKICVPPTTENRVPAGTGSEFVHENDTFYCSQKDHDDYAKALMSRSKKERGNEGLIVTAAIGGSAVLIIGFFGWAYYMFGMQG